MIVSMTYDEFCRKYYPEADKVAEITIANHIKQHGKINRRIDIDLVKDLGISYALEKVFLKYDVDNEKHASVKTFLSTVVRNCVLTELGKENTSIGGGGNGISPEDLAKSGKEYRVSDYIKYEERYERKEETLKELMACVKKLSPDDQVIIGYWMEDKRTYVARALAEFGMEDTKSSRNIIYIRQNRALNLLKAMMGGVKPDYRNMYVHIPRGSAPATPEALNAQRRRQRAAASYITRNVDYNNLVDTFYSRLAE